MRISITPRAALVALLGLPVLVLWPAWWTVLLVLLAWLLVVLGDAFLAPSPRQLTVHRDAPGQVRLGGEAGGRLLVTNPTQRGSSYLRWGWASPPPMSSMRSR